MDLRKEHREPNHYYETYTPFEYEFKAFWLGMKLSSSESIDTLLLKSTALMLSMNKDKLNKIFTLRKIEERRKNKVW